MKLRARSNALQEEAKSCGHSLNETQMVLIEKYMTSYAVNCVFRYQFNPQQTLNDMDADINDEAVRREEYLKNG